MERGCITVCALAASLALLTGSGCAKKGIQSTSEMDLATHGQAGQELAMTGEGSGLEPGRTPGGRGQRGQRGFSEQEFAGGPLGSSGEGPGGPRSGEFGESDVGGPGGMFGSVGEGGPGTFGGGGFGSGPGPGGDQPGFGRQGFGGGSGFDPSREGRGDVPDLGTFSEGIGEGSLGGGALGGFEAVEPGRSPSEDRIDEGMRVAKADPSEAGKSQVEAMQEERRAITARELEDVFFGFDSWSISEQGRAVLTQNAAWLRANPSRRVTIEGHCDERGAATYNLVLGEKRAKAVRDYLLELGVSPQRVKIVSFGKERPFCNDSTEKCYELNRRGHLVVR